MLRNESNGTAAFTLIELLVVISIIAILASLLFPVFAQAKESAKRSTCVSNEREIGMALDMYVDDADGVFPSIRFTVLDTGYTWFNAVQPYVNGKRIFSCPSNPVGNLTNAAGYESEPDQILYRSYGFSSCVESYHPIDGSDGKPGPPLSEATITTPATTVELAEQTGSSSGSPDFLAAALMESIGQCARPFRHGGLPGANLLRFDGHVKFTFWRQSLFPIVSNSWELNPNPSPVNGLIECGGVPGASFDSAGPLCPGL